MFTYNYCSSNSIGKKACPCGTYVFTVLFLSSLTEKKDLIKINHVVFKRFSARIVSDVVLELSTDSATRFPSVVVTLTTSVLQFSFYVFHFEFELLKKHCIYVCD